MLEHYISRQKHEHKSDKWVELNITKEFLISEQISLNTEIKSIDDLKIKEYFKNIILSEMNNRLKIINHLLNKVKYDIKICVNV